MDKSESMSIFGEADSDDLFVFSLTHPFLFVYSARDQQSYHLGNFLRAKFLNAAKKVVPSQG